MEYALKDKEGRKFLAEMMGVKISKVDYVVRRFRQGFPVEFVDGINAITSQDHRLAAAHRYKRLATDVTAIAPMDVPYSLYHRERMTPQIFVYLHDMAKIITARGEVDCGDVKIVNLRAAVQEIYGEDPDYGDKFRRWVWEDSHVKGWFKGQITGGKLYWADLGATCFADWYTKNMEQNTGPELVVGPDQYPSPARTAGLPLNKQQSNPGKGKTLTELPLPGGIHTGYFFIKNGVDQRGINPQRKGNLRNDVQEPQNDSV